MSTGEEPGRRWYGNAPRRCRGWPSRWPCLRTARRGNGWRADPPPPDQIDGVIPPPVYSGGTRGLSDPLVDASWAAGPQGTISTAIPTGAQPYSHSATPIGRLTQPWLIGAPKLSCQ